MANTWTGLDKYIADVKSLTGNKMKIQKDFIDIAGRVIIDIMLRTTPKVEGDLSRSWYIVAKGKDFVEVGTSMHDAFLRVVNGTSPHVIRAKRAKTLHFIIGGQDFFRLEVFHKGTRSNPYINPIVKGLDRLIQALLHNLMVKYWKIYNIKSAPKIRAFNASKTVGISTGTKRNTRRGRGGSGTMVIRSGRKSFKRKLGRRRRTGQFITSKKARAG